MNKNKRKTAVTLLILAFVAISVVALYLASKHETQEEPVTEQYETVIVDGQELVIIDNVLVPRF